MKSAASKSATRDSVLARLMDEYLASCEAGQPLTTDDLAARYPELADDVAACLASLDFIRHAARGAGSLPALKNPLPLGEGGERSSPGEGVQIPAGILGDFRILREIGHGGMGVVYEAEQISLSRRVALKVLPFAAVLDPKQLVRFKNEALAAAQLDHPHIVDVLGVGCDRGTHFYAMRFIDGRTLAEVIEELRQQRDEKGRQGEGETGRQPAPESTELLAHSATLPLSPSPCLPVSPAAFFRRAAELIADAADALHHAHEQGIIHRDIKPSNLMLDQAGKIWITDFGLAHIESGVTLTVTGDFLGTLRYMSPEQALGSRIGVDHRTDIYSLGVTLYELLTLEPAWRGETRAELLRLISDTDPPAPRALNRSIPPELETITLKCLSKSPLDRYPTAADLAADLRRYLTDQPIHAKPANILQNAAKWARRHKYIVNSALAICLMTIAALLLTTYLLARKEAEIRRALAAETASHHRALAAAAAERAAAAAEAEQRRRAEEQMRLVEEQRQLLKNNERVNAMVTEEILTVLRDLPVPAAKRRSLLVTVLSRLSDPDPADRVAAFHSAGNQFVVMNEYPAALAAYDEGLSLAPHHAGIYISRGDVFFRQKEYEKAASDYTAALAHRQEKDPANVELPYTRRAFAHCQLGRFDEALADFRASYDESPAPTLSLLEKGFRGAYVTHAPFDDRLHAAILALLDRYIDDQQQSTAAVQFAADRLAELKLYDAARQRLEAIEGIGPKDWYTHHQLGVLALQRSDMDEYRRVCRAALYRASRSLDEEVIQAWYFSGTMFCWAPDMVEDYTAAIDLARRALAKRPGSAYRRYVLGAMLYRAGQYDEALQRLHAALQTTQDSNGENVRGPFFLAMTYHQLGRPEDAQQWLQRGRAAAASAPYFNWRFQQGLQSVRREATQLLEPQPADKPKAEAFRPGTAILPATTVLGDRKNTAAYRPPRNDSYILSIFPARFVPFSPIEQ